MYGLFFTRVVWHIYQRKRSFAGNITSSQTKKNEKDASIFMEVFIVFLFFFLLMIRLFECRFNDILDNMFECAFINTTEETKVFVG